MHTPLPRLFVIGDSISIQYGPNLKKLGAGIFTYDRKRDDTDSPSSSANLDTPTGANGGDSDMVLAYLRHRRIQAPILADILLLNCGLHDIKTDCSTGQKQVPLDRYKQNLRAIISEVRLMRLRLVWIRTTPVSDHIHNSHMIGFLRFANDIATYNAAADVIMTESEVPVIDLHGFSETLLPSGFSDHVHYTEDAQQKQADFLLSELRRIVFAPSPPHIHANQPVRM